jgi:hypothetical protein
MCEGAATSLLGTRFIQPGLSPADHGAPLTIGLWDELARTPATEDQAEWVAGGIREDAEPLLAPGRETTGPELEDHTLSRVHVVDTDVQVKLLRKARVGPPGRNPGHRPLERQLPGSRSAPDHDPVLAILVDPHAQDLGVERRERPRIRAVKHGLLQTADHRSQHAGRPSHNPQEDPLLDADAVENG